MICCLNDLFTHLRNSPTLYSISVIFRQTMRMRNGLNCTSRQFSEWSLVFSMKIDGPGLDVPRPWQLGERENAWW